MAEEDKTQTTAPDGAPDTPDTQAQAPAEAPAADDAAPAQDAPAAEEVPVPDAEAPAVADEPAPEPAAAAPAPASPAAPVTPQLPREQRRAAARSRRGLRRGATPEERQTLRAAKAAARRRRREQERAKRSGAPSGEGTPAAERKPGNPQLRLGKVVSDKTDKTITVRIDIAKRHRRYRKIVRSTATLHAHDERNDANAGDTVRVVECRPMSRTKRWRLVEILERAK